MLRFDTRAWVTWVVATATIIMVTRNPLYTVIVLFVAFAATEECGQEEASLKFPVLRIGVVILLFSTLFNLFSLHIGNTVLFRLPSNWPLVGGAITLEAAVNGFVNGLVLITLLAVFVAFNRIVPVSELVRLTPRALRDLGVVILIAVTYVPVTIRQLHHIREAQAIRGHKLNGVRAWRPIVVPLLIGSLERAVGLAEAMVTRGYGATADVGQPLTVQLVTVAGLLAALSGSVLTFWIGWPGWLLFGVGVGLILYVLIRRSRAIPYTRYRSRSWKARDTLMLLTISLSSLFIFVPLPFVDQTTLSYRSYPSLSVPRFDPVIGMSLASLAVPALLSSIRKVSSSHD